MQDNFLAVLIFVIDNPLYTIVMACLAGFLATRFVAAERRPGTIGFSIIGLIGFFLGRFALTHFELNETLDSLHQLRFVIDLVASFAGSFAIASLIHFIKPS
jgi:uncharacterized membrane protein YeaQ/YmgE (transglycosylase-associated protein family)